MKKEKRLKKILTSKNLLILVLVAMFSMNVWALLSVQSGKNSPIKDGVKLGVVSIKKIQVMSEVTKDLNAQKQAEIKKFQLYVKNKEATFRKKEQAIKAQSKTLSEDALRKKFMELQKYGIKMKTEAEQKMGKIQFAYKSAVQEIQVKYLNPILKDIADEKGFDILTTSTDTVVINPYLDITDEVIKKLNMKVKEIKMKDPETIKSVKK